MANIDRRGGRDAWPARWPDERVMKMKVATGVDVERVSTAARDILEAIGEDPDREGLRDTPVRVARMYAELFDGLHTDPAGVLTAVFTEAHQEMVVVRDVPFYSMCEHHLLPFHVVAHFGYLPNGRVVGLSKVARLMECVSRRP